MIIATLIFLFMTIHTRIAKCAAQPVENQIANIKTF